MTDPAAHLTDDDWHRIDDALRYMGRDLHHRTSGAPLHHED